MKKQILSALAVLTVAASGTAQLVITSFSQNGALTWTNVVSNATYRVEWAGSPAGPWLSFDALTNLTSLSATNKSVAVTVPTCYRVVWLDPPPPEPEGVWDYRAWDYDGVLLVTGRFSLVFRTNLFENTKGTRDLQLTGNRSTNGYYALQKGTGDISGRLTGFDFSLNLDPWTSDENIILRGRMFGAYVSGDWAFLGFGGGPEYLGAFVAVKAAPPPGTADGPAP